MVSTCRPRNVTTHHAMIFGVILTCGSEGLVRNGTSSPGIFSVQMRRDASFGLTPSCDQPEVHSTRSWRVAIHVSTPLRSRFNQSVHAGLLATRCLAPA